MEGVVQRARSSLWLRHLLDGVAMSVPHRSTKLKRVIVH